MLKSRAMGIQQKELKLSFVKMLSGSNAFSSSVNVISNAICKAKKNCFSGPPSSVSDAPHLSFFQT